MSEHLKKITDLAKKLRKAKPSLKWIDAVKTAAKNIAKLPATKKKKSVKIVGIKKPIKKEVIKYVNIFGQKVKVGTKKYNILMQQKKQFDDIQKNEINGWVKGKTHIIEQNEKKVGNFKTVKVHRAPKGSLLKPGTFNYFQPIVGVKYPTRKEIILTGINKASTLQKLVPEVKVKVLRGKFAPTDIIKSITDSVDVLRKFFTKNKIETQEYFAVMFLNQQNKVLGIYINSMGTMNSATVDVRLVMSAALQIGALGMILCHNHPSGNLTPSEADLQLTKGLKKACDQLSINMFDHIILTKNGFYSFLNAGKL